MSEREQVQQDIPEKPSPNLFNDLVGAREQGQRNFKAEREGRALIQMRTSCIDLFLPECLVERHLQRANEIIKGGAFHGWNHHGRRHPRIEMDMR